MIVVCRVQFKKKTGKKDFFAFFFCFVTFSLSLIGNIFSIFAPGFTVICSMKYLYIVLGTLSLALGIIGIFLPVLPTTPFLLLTAALYLRSSDRLYCWLMSHRHLGPYIKNFQENKAIPLRVKVISVSMVWVTLLYCAIFVAEVWWMRVMFISIAIGVTLHILHYKTARIDNREQSTENR